MKHIVKLLILALALATCSCVKEGHVCYRFVVLNATSEPMNVRLSSWGKYTMYINGQYDSRHKFTEVETIDPNSTLIFDVQIGDDPDPNVIPSSLTPAWEYIESIEIDGVRIPKEYYANRDNWDLAVLNQINGTFTKIGLAITPELIAGLSQSGANP